MLPSVKMWQMGIFISLILILAACSGTPQPSPNNNVPSNLHQLIVYVVGLGEQLLASDTTRNGGYGYEKSFYEPGAIQPYLQATSEFKNAQSLVFSYEGFILDGEPQTFSCTDTFNNRIAFDASLLNLQISQYLKKHPQTQVYIVAHSLGGVIAFAYMASQIENTHSTALENGGVLKGIAILDSPLGGVTNESNYENAIIARALMCDFQEVDLYYHW